MFLSFPLYLFIQGISVYYYHEPILWSIKLEQEMFFDLLMQLEQSIRSIAFSGTWFKLLNDGLLKFPATTICTSLNGPSQKRGPGRRSKKQLASESSLASSESTRKDVQWWRGGKLSKVVLQAETLPSSLVKKAARQGKINLQRFFSLLIPCYSLRILPIYL